MASLNNMAQRLLTGAEDLPWLEQGLLSSKKGLLGNLQDGEFSR